MYYINTGWNFFFSDYQYYSTQNSVLARLLLLFLTTACPGDHVWNFGIKSLLLANVFIWQLIVICYLFFPGGEPLVRRDLVEIISELNAIGGLEKIGITTNAVTLSRKLPALKAAGLNSINISLDTLIKPKFEFITRRKGHDRVLKAIDEAIEADIGRVKINCVVMRGTNDDEVLDFVEMTKDKPLDVRFIEYMPFDGNKWNDKRMVPYAELLNIIRSKYGNLEKSQDDPNDTSKAFQVSN